MELKDHLHVRFRRTILHSSNAFSEYNCGAIDGISEIMPALQCYIPDLNETYTDILSVAKCFILRFKKKTFCTGYFSLRYFTILCNTDEYKLMGQDPLSWSVVQCTELNKDIYNQLIYYDTSIFLFIRM